MLNISSFASLYCKLAVSWNVPKKLYIVVVEWTLTVVISHSCDLSHTGSVASSYL